MKQLKKLLQKKWVFACVLAAAIVVFAFSGVQTSRAALTAVSDYYSAQMSVAQNMDIAIVENGADVTEDGALLAGLAQTAEEEGGVKLGKDYDEVLAVHNAGEIDEYVRVILYRYWEDEAGKRADLDPAFIDLQLTEGAWVVDEAASTPERMVLYYTAPLAAGATSAPLSDVLRIDGSLATALTQTEASGTITTTFDYSGVQFVLEAEADGVQTHNAYDAIRSAWGVDVTIDAGGTLSLNG